MPINDLVAAPKGATFVATADFEDDLDLDLAASTANKTASAITNSGTGKFTAGALFPTNFTPTKLYACDINGDEDADLIFTNNKDQFKVLRGSIEDTFTAAPTTMRIAAIIAGGS